jgi:TRAP transporter TAXI family solute receptor
MKMKKLSILVALFGIFLLVFAAPAASKTVFLGIGTGGTGGIYYPYGGGVAEIWTKYVPGVKAVAEVTGASVENVKLASKGETVVGEVMGDVAVAGYNGTSKFKGKKQKDFVHGHHVPQSASDGDPQRQRYYNVEQVKGKTISTGSPGSGTNFMAEEVFKALGIAKDAYKDSRLSFTESANALRDGMIEMGTWCVGPGTSSIMDLATTHDIRILPFTPEQTKKILAANKTYSAIELSGGCVSRGG